MAWISFLMGTRMVVEIHSQRRGAPEIDGIPSPRIGNRNFLISLSFMKLCLSQRYSAQIECSCSVAPIFLRTTIGGPSRGSFSARRWNSQSRSNAASTTRPTSAATCGGMTWGTARHHSSPAPARISSRRPTAAPPRFRATFGRKPSRDERTLSANGSSAVGSPLAAKFGEVCAPRIARAAPSRGVFDALHTSSCQIRVKMKKRAGSAGSLTARFDLVAGPGFEPRPSGYEPEKRCDEEPCDICTHATQRS